MLKKLNIDFKISYTEMFRGTALFILPILVILIGDAKKIETIRNNSLSDWTLQWTVPFFLITLSLISVGALSQYLKRSDRKTKSKISQHFQKSNRAAKPIRF